MADDGVDLRDRSPREGRSRERADGGGGFVVSKPVEDVREDCQRHAQVGEAARVVKVADGYGQVIEGVCGLPYTAASCARGPARCDSISSLPLSWGIVRPRRRASYAATPSTER